MDVEFCQMFFYIYWDGHMIFILYFVNVVYHINWFADAEQPHITEISPIWSWCMYHDLNSVC